jgi:hypothetical protein
LIFYSGNGLGSETVVLCKAYVKRKSLSHFLVREAFLLLRVQTN